MAQKYSLDCDVDLGGIESRIMFFEYSGFIETSTRIPIKTIGLFQAHFINDWIRARRNYSARVDIMHPGSDAMKFYFLSLYHTDREFLQNKTLTGPLEEEL